jgi:site-specific DNA recombinase
LPKPRTRRGYIQVDLPENCRGQTEIEQVLPQTGSRQLRSPADDTEIPTHLRIQIHDLAAVEEQDEVVSTRPRKAILYARLSRPRNKEESIARQLATCKRWADRHNIEIVAIFYDVRSGKSKWRRSGLESALNKIREGGIDLFIVEEFSRLARSIADGGTIYRLLRFHDVELVSIYQGRANLVNLAQKMAEAEGYVDETNLKNRDARRKKFFDGAYDGPCRYGYRPQRDADGCEIKGKLEIHPDHRPIVQWIFEAIAAGIKPCSVVKYLNARGVPGPTGQKWTTSYLLGDANSHGMLYCEKYMGWVTWEKTSSRENPDTGLIEKHLNEKWFVRRAPHLKIVEREIWERAQRELNRQRRLVTPSQDQPSRKDGGRSESLLSGILMCEKCGATMHAASTYHSKASGEIINRGYKCSRFTSFQHVNRSDVVKCTNSREVNGRLVETAIIDEICSQLDGPVPFRVFTERYKKTSRRGTDRQVGSEIQTIKDNIAINLKLIEGYTAAMSSPTWDVDYAGSQITPLLRENERLQKQLSILEHEKPDLCFKVDRLEEYKTLADAARRCLPAEAKSDKELFAVGSLKSIIENVVVYMDPDCRDFTVEFSLFIGDFVSDANALQGDEEEGWVRLSRTVSIRRAWADNKIKLKHDPTAPASIIPQLDDEVWNAINILFNRSKTARKDAHANDRRALEHILYKFTTNTPFKDLPGRGLLCFKRLEEWNADGIWPKIFQTLEEKFPSVLTDFDYMVFESIFESDVFREQTVCQILREQSKPMPLRELWDAMIARGVWPGRGDSGIGRLQAILNRSSRILSLPSRGYRLTEISLAAVRGK